MEAIAPTDAFGNPWYNIKCLDSIRMGDLKFQFETDESIACYHPITHTVVMPKMCEGFKSSAHYYQTFLHELAHATAKNLGRPIASTFGSVEYANEELIAELTAWVLSVEMGLWMESDEKATSPAYLNHWLSQMKESPDYLRTIMVEVNKACAMIRKAIKIETEIEAKPMDESHS